MKMIRRRGGNIKVHQFNTDIRGNAAPVGQSVSRSVPGGPQEHTENEFVLQRPEKKTEKFVFFQFVA